MCSRDRGAACTAFAGPDAPELALQSNLQLEQTKRESSRGSLLETCTGAGLSQALGALRRLLHIKGGIHSKAWSPSRAPNTRPAKSTASPLRVEHQLCQGRGSHCYPMHGPSLTHAKIQNSGSKFWIPNGSSTPGSIVDAPWVRAWCCQSTH